MMTEMSVLAALVLVCAALAAGLFWSALQIVRQRSIARALAVGELQASESRASQGRFGILLAELKRSIASSLETRAPQSWKTALLRQITLADLNLSPGEVLASSLALGFSLAAGFALVEGGPVAMAAALIAGMALPWVRLRDTAKKRLERIQAQLPDAVDLLAAAVSAGLGFDQALNRVLPLLEVGPLKKELEKSASDMRLGRARAEALRSMEHRVGSQDMSELVLALVQSDQQGLPLAPVLLAQAKQVRILRGLRAQKLAAQAPIKLLFPLMVFILPVVFLVLLGPIYLAWSIGGF